MSHTPLKAAGGVAGLCGLVVWATLPSWTAGFSGEDFPGHLALLESLLARFPEGLPLWSSDLGAGTSLDLQYLHPIGSLLALAPFALVWGPELGLRIGDSAFLFLAAVAMGAWCRSLGVTHAGA